MINECVDSYFTAWILHDSLAIKRLFTPEATYNIKPRKRVLKGQEEICAYWDRNKERQDNLTVEWTIIQLSKKRAKSDFTAIFFDNVDQQHQTITGTIKFLFNTKGQIVALSETYKKIIILLETNAPQNMP